MNDRLKDILIHELSARNGAILSALMQSDVKAVKEILKDKGFSRETLELEEAEIGPFLDEVLSSKINDDSFVGWLLARRKEQATLKRKCDDEPSTSASKKCWSVSFAHLKAAIETENYDRIKDFRDAMDIDWQGNTSELKEILDAIYAVSFDISTEAAFNMFDLLCGKNGININLPDARGQTLLHYAVDKIKDRFWEDDDDDLFDGQGNIQEEVTEVVDYLLEKGADVNLADNDGNTPFHLILQPRCWPAIEHLLQNNANPNLQNGNGEIPFHRAIKLYAEEENGTLSLLERITTFLKSGADANLPDNDKNTPLHLAIEHCRTEEEQERVITAFLEAGADIHLQNCHGKTPLDYVHEAVAQRAALREEWQMDASTFAFFSQWMPIYHPLLSFPPTSGAKFLPAEKIRTFVNSADLIIVIKAYLEYVNTKHKKDVSLLKILNLFIANKTNIYLQDVNGEISLHRIIATFSYSIAPPEQQEEIITAFVEAGVDLHLKDGYGKTPLDYATRAIAKRAVLKEDWVMYGPNYNSFFQWFPREMAEDVIELLDSTGIPRPGK